MNICTRLRQAIDDSGMNIREFSESTGVPYVTLQQYLAGKRSPATEALSKICIQTNININWLLTGQGEMHRAPQAANDAEKELSRRQAGMLELFNALDEKQQREILSVAEEKERLNRMEQELGEIRKKLG
ncbi:helix-turn-helix domain-containing protein [Methylovulum psychrotolerans]|uniref:Helix-turn-helix domain-containing protein n=2 Tax=Methylovulum psychrotolerans TaxID=1704499 RepID=A0A2S5CKI2_9GAMM|nr:helix-turn-helix domain-containing protein [Methylovulum psychrotolerans]